VSLVVAVLILVYFLVLVTLSFSFIFCDRAHNSPSLATQSVKKHVSADGGWKKLQVLWRLGGFQWG